MSNAIDMYLRQIVMNKGIPFAVRMNINAPVAMEALSKEEFDAEIAKGIDDIRAGRTFTAAEVRADMERDFGIAIEYGITTQYYSCKSDGNDGNDGRRGE